MADKIVFIANEYQKEDMMHSFVDPEIEITWLPDILDLPPAHFYIDLLFKLDDARIDLLKTKSSVLIIVNSVETTLKDLPSSFVRINGWPGFLKKEIIEASSNNIHKEKVENIFSLFNKKIEWVPDIPGFIAPRVISMIINEAYFSLEENISTKNEIDIAMKLGTNYPYGPFEWSEKIGLKNIFNLLTNLSGMHSRYTPSSLLRKEALL